MSVDLADYRQRYAGLSADKILEKAAADFGGRLVFGSSLGLEDAVILEMIAANKLPIPVFTLDTGRLFPETYDLIERIHHHYGIRIQILFPAAGEVEALVNRQGPNLFRSSIEARKACCHVRKGEPLKRALAGNSAWICGLRREQSVTRSSLEPVEWDEGSLMLKISPLAGWSEDEVNTFVREKKVPVNPLHSQGYPSIGCACCTRPVKPGEDIRAGRWWWENPDTKECGLHRCPPSVS